MTITVEIRVELHVPGSGRGPGQLGSRPGYDTTGKLAVDNLIGLTREATRTLLVMLGGLASVAPTITNLGAAPLTAPAAEVVVGKLAAVAAPAGRFVGTLALGSFKRLQVKRVVWNNSNSDAYQIGIVPSASSGYPCSFPVVRTWHVRTSAGQRRLYFEVRGEGNDGLYGGGRARRPVRDPDLDDRQPAGRCVEVVQMEQREPAVGHLHRRPRPRRELLRV